VSPLISPATPSYNMSASPGFQHHAAKGSVTVTTPRYSVVTPRYAEASTPRFAQSQTQVRALEWPLSGIGIDSVKEPTILQSSWHGTAALCLGGVESEIANSGPNVSHDTCMSRRKDRAEYQRRAFFS
jgi:hypothetical protein